MNLSNRSGAESWLAGWRESKDGRVKTRRENRGVRVGEVKVSLIRQKMRMKQLSIILNRVQCFPFPHAHHSCVHLLFPPIYTHTNTQITALKTDYKVRVFWFLITILPWNKNLFHFSRLPNKCSIHSLSVLSFGLV